MGDMIDGMYRIAFTPAAVDDLGTLRKYDVQRILAEVEKQLADEPATLTRNRKQLRPNQLAEWELRIADFRVFYDIMVHESVVRIVAVGQKVGGQLFIHGERYEL